MDEPKAGQRWRYNGDTTVVTILYVGNRRVFVRFGARGHRGAEDSIGLHRLTTKFTLLKQEGE